MNEENLEEGSKSDITDLYWGSIAEVPAFLVTWYFADHPSFGRRKSLILTLFSSSIMMVLLLMIGYPALIILTAISKFFIGMAFILIY